MTDNQALLAITLLEEYGEWYHEECNKFSSGSRELKPKLNEFIQNKITENDLEGLVKVGNAVNKLSND